MPFISFAIPEGEPPSDLVHHFYVFVFCGHRIACSSNLSSTLVLPGQVYLCEFRNVVIFVSSCLSVFNVLASSEKKKKRHVKTFCSARTQGHYSHLLYISQIVRAL